MMSPLDVLVLAVIVWTVMAAALIMSRIDRRKRIKADLKILLEEEKNNKNDW
jgi:hypothetical protein